MSDSASPGPHPSRLDGDPPHGAVIVGAVPGQSKRVVIEAGRYARLMSAPLAVVHVDVTRFVTFEDPDGFVHPAPVGVEASAAASQLAEVREAAAAALEGCGVEWDAYQLLGDPAMAMAHLAERIDAPLFVIGTRRRGIGQSLREFLTGSVAARLSHRQRRPVLIVPLGDTLPADEDIVWD